MNGGLVLTIMVFIQSAVVWFQHIRQLSPRLLLKTARSPYKVV